MLDWALAQVRYEQTATRRGRKPPRPSQPADPDYGHPIELDLTTRTVKFHPHLARPDNQGRITLSAGTQADFDVQVQVYVSRLRSRGIAVPAVPPPRHEPIGAVNAGVMLDRYIWGRAGAKWALGCASLRWRDEWLDSPSAQMLRGWLWDAAPRALDGDRELIAFPRRVEEGDPFRALCPPPGHFLGFMETQGQYPTRFVGILFGALQVVIPLDREGQTAPHAAWHLDSVALRHRRTSMVSAIVEATPFLDDD